MAEQPLEISNSSEDNNNDSEDLSEFAELKYFQHLLAFEHLLKQRTSCSTMELLLLLHSFLNHMTAKCQCYLNELFVNSSFKFLRKYFTLMKDLLEYISKIISSNLVRSYYSDWKSDYQLHLLVLLSISFRKLHYDIKLGYPPRNEVDQRLENELLTTINQIRNNIAILISRHGWHYRKEMQRCSKPSRDRLPTQLPIRHQFFNHYERCADIGRFPHIFWQETALREKISQCNSLDMIFSNGNEKICCICWDDEEGIKDNFAIFLECNHLVCSSCADWLLVDLAQTR